MLDGEVHTHNNLPRSSAFIRVHLRPPLWSSVVNRGYLSPAPKLMNHDYEYIVLGLGGFGSAAAYWLARRAGGDVLGLEQFELGHVRGESQDHSRIIRLSYHEPHYVELAKHAYRAWAEVEQEAGEQLVLRTGWLDLGPRESAIPLATYSDSMDEAGVPYERLDAAEIMRRWPQWRLDDDIHGLFQAGGGDALAPVAARRRHPRPVPGGGRDRDGRPRQRRASAPGPGARRDPPGSDAGGR